MGARHLAKVAAFGLSLVVAAPWIALARLERALGLGEQLFLLGAQSLAIAPGAPGHRLV